MTDLELMQKCAGGELRYFGEIYERYVNKIFRFVFLKISDKEISEDIVSEVFVSALNKAEDFKIDEHSSVSAWLYKIAYNKVIDHYKANRPEDQIEENMDFAYDSDFAKNVDNRDKLTQVFNYIKTFKKEYREVIIYRFWYDMSYKEISEVTGLSTDNCKQIVSRSLKNIAANVTLLLLILLII